MTGTDTIAVPDGLTELDQWVAWKYESRDGGKVTKVPYQVSRVRASTSDPSTWCTFQGALKVVQESPEHCYRTSGG
jgi:putative DNA primase/helicase